MMLAYIRKVGANGIPCRYAAMPTMPVDITRLNHAGFSPLKASENSFSISLATVSSFPAR